MALSHALFLQVQVRADAPQVRFKRAPLLVEVQPGVLVVYDHDEEVFFVGGRYWTRWRDGRWYGARDYHGGWVMAEPRTIPESLTRLPLGAYKHHHTRSKKFRVATADGSVVDYPNAR